MRKCIGKSKQANVQMREVLEKRNAGVEIMKTLTRKYFRPGDWSEVSRFKVSKEHPKKLSIEISSHNDLSSWHYRSIKIKKDLKKCDIRRLGIRMAPDISKANLKARNNEETRGKHISHQ